MLGGGLCALGLWVACGLNRRVVLWGVVPHCGPLRGLEEGEWWAMAVGMAIALVGELSWVAVGCGLQPPPPPVELSPKSSSISSAKSLWCQSGL